jgi:CelD/BcsL family acetyltransferase involved in cellulose biosynthesis
MTAIASRIEEQRGVNGLTAIAAEWSDLCDRTTATPLQRPEWLRPFAQVFEGEALAVALRLKGALIAVLPLVERRRPIESTGDTTRRTAATSLTRST